MKCINKKYFNNAAAFYDRADLTAQEKRIINTFLKGEKILDLCCGVGRTTINLHRKGFDVIGIDYSFPLIKRAKEKFPEIDFYTMDAAKLDFKNNSFDIVFCSYNGLDYLYPYSKRYTALREAYRVLKKRGRIVYSSHKRVYFRSPLKLTFPFIRTHYVRTFFASLFAFNNYRYETHPFGRLKTYCKNNSTKELINAGFEKIIKIPCGYTNYYIGFKK